MIRLLMAMVMCVILVGCSSGNGQSTTSGPAPTIDTTDDETYSDSTDAVRRALPNYERGAFTRALASLAKPMNPKAGQVSPAVLAKHLHGMTGAQVIEMAYAKPAKKRK